MKNKIVLNTMTDVRQFNAVTNRINEEVFVEDGEGNRVNAKSFLGLCYAKLEWDKIYIVSDRDISAMIMPWIYDQE